MFSGLVYFEEVLEGVKENTGIVTLESRHNEISNLIFRAEKDIAAGGLIVRKQRTYTNGDGTYDGRYIKLPEDLVGEYSYSSLNTANFRGDKLELIEYPGPDSVDFSYMGWLLDTNGRPVTTHNHYEAVVAFITLSFYRQRMFQGVAGTSRNYYKDLFHEYNDLCLAARGNDAFPNEEQWAEIGQILRQPFSAVMTPCGLTYVDDGLTSTAPIDGGGTPGECGDLTIDMVAIYNTAKTD